MRFLFLVTLVGAALMPSVPDAADFRAVLVAGATALLLLLWVALSLLRGSFSRSLAGASLFCFLLLVGISGVTASLFGTDVSLWLRGAIPFLFLAIFFPAYDLARNNASWVVHAIAVSAVVWLIATGVTSVGAVPQLLSGEVHRITHATEAWAAFQLPYAMIGLALMLFYPVVHSSWLRWPLAIGFTLLPLLAVSRGQIAAVAGLWLLFAVFGKRRSGLGHLSLTLVIVAMCVLLLLSEIGASLIARYAQLWEFEESSRAAEIRYAWEQFAESPLVGKGLGYQIPAEITFLGDWTAILSADVNTVGYMHNVVGYLLMNLGLLGFVSYGGFIFAGLRGAWKAWRTADSGVVIASGLALGCLLLWFMVQASFRQIQSNLLLASLVAVLVASGARQKRVPHA